MKILIVLFAATVAVMGQATARCPDGEYYTGYECRDKTPGRPELCPLYVQSPPSGGRARCVNGGNNFWYIHVGGNREDWNEGTDAMCLSTSSRPAAWGREHCQFSWREEGCREILEHAGCPDKDAEESSEESSRSGEIVEPSHVKDEEPLIRCKRPMCRMFCELGFQTDETGCPVCACLENPCAAIECQTGEICRPEKCEGHPCIALAAQCVPDMKVGPLAPLPEEPAEPMPDMPCAMPMCASHCPYGYANDEHGCMTCKCKGVTPLCEKKREELMHARPGPRPDPFDPFRTGMRDVPKPRLGELAMRMRMMSAPQCDESGNFRPRQCSPMKHACWCVDDRGMFLNGTAQRVFDDDEEDDLVQCKANHTTAIHMKFKMHHEMPKEDIDMHLPHIQSAVHAHLSEWLMVEKRYIVVMKVAPDTIEEHMIVVEFLVERDGDADLSSAAHGMHLAMKEGEFSLQVKGTTFTPKPETLTMDHKFDQPMLPPQGLVPRNETWMCRRFRRFYRHHRVASIVAGVGGVFILGSILFIIVAQYTKKRRSAHLQFQHKRMETMENFKQNLVLDWGHNHPDLTDEKKKPIGDEPVLISSVNLEETSENKDSLA